MKRISMSRVSRFLRAAAGLVALAGFAALPEASAAPPGAPAEMRVAFVDFFSGPAAIFGTSGKNAAEWLVDKWNKEGGIRGVKIKLITLDEAGTPDKVVTEFRRLVLDEKAEVISGYTSSANALAVAPVAEELKALTLIHIGGTRRLTEERQLKYTFRTSNHQAADSIMAARYVLRMKPDIKTIAGAQDDYAWGRDSWEDFKGTILRLKPDVKVVAELWTKFQAGEYSAEISRLLAAKPDMIHSSFWGGGLVTFVKQAAPRGLFKSSLVYLSTGEQVMQELKRDMPDGIVVAPRATGGYFLYPEPEKNPMQKEFVEAMKARFGRYPDYVAYRTYQALAGMKAGYEKAIDQGGGKWPKSEEVITALEGLTWQTPIGPVTMRADHQAVHGAILGVTKFNAKFGFPTMERVEVLKAEEVIPPVGMKTPDWIASFKK